MTRTARTVASSATLATALLAPACAVAAEAAYVPHQYHYLYFTPYVVLACGALVALALTRIARLHAGARALVFVAATALLAAAAIAALARAQRGWDRVALERGAELVVKPALDHAFAGNTFARAFCAGALDAAATAAKLPDQVRDSAVLQRVIEHCLTVPVDDSVHEALVAERVPVLLDALLAHARAAGTDASAPHSGCTGPALALLGKLYLHGRIEALQTFHDRGLAIDCEDASMTPHQPLWWQAVKDREPPPDSADFVRLQALGIDLKQRNAIGAQVLDGHVAHALSDSALLYLVEQGLDLQPAHVFPHLSLEVMYRRFSGPRLHNPEALEQLLQKVGEPTLAQLQAATGVFDPVQRAHALGRAGGDEAGLLEHLRQRGLRTDAAESAVRR